jgi:hypothetical protein
MGIFEKVVGLLERLAKIYRELIIFVFLLILFGEDLYVFWRIISG